MDRKAIAQALAKVCAYINCGQPAKAEKWFRVLANLLEMDKCLNNGTD